MTNIHIYDNEDQISHASGLLIASHVLNKPGCVLGLATGSTALLPYRTLIDLHRQGTVSFQNCVSFNLDEYCKLDPADRNSYRSFMEENLFNQIDIKRENTHFLDGQAADVQAECQRYEDEIAACGGIDIQLLGIGSNGHIAFNEPGPHFYRMAHKVALKESTIRDNARFFDRVEDVPTHALTMGIGSIMNAKNILIIATGEK
ncbi:MAG: glucosamine-6-phosphate deaminase, partial [Clostridiales bacterium]|nr:glucosamine-6-phosphate deaminase [Clostridiales bacterium]